MNSHLPKTRGECRGGPRPCPLISCKWHLIWEMPKPEVRPMLKKSVQNAVWTRTGRNGGYSIQHWDSDDKLIDYIIAMKETCTLDVSETREATLEEIGEIWHVTRERIRQIEGTGRTKGGCLKKLRHPSKAKYLRDFAEA